MSLQTPLNYLPDELWIKILEFLPIQDLCSFQLISQNHFELVAGDENCTNYYKIAAKKLGKEIDKDINLKIFMKRIDDLNRWSLWHFFSHRIGILNYVMSDIVEINLKNLKYTFTNYDLDINNLKQIIFGEAKEGRGVYVEIQGNDFAYRIYQYYKALPKEWGVTETFEIMKMRSTLQLLPPSLRKASSSISITNSEIKDYFRKFFDPKTKEISLLIQYQNIFTCKWNGLY